MKEEIRRLAVADDGRELETSLEEGIKLLNVRRDPFEIYGLYEPREEGGFKRLPDDVAEATSKGVVKGYKMTAGGRVRFSTDSDVIAIVAKEPFVTRRYHMSALSCAGFDIYEDTDGGSRYVGCFRCPPDMTDGYEAVIHLGDRKMRSFTINMPPYNPVDELYIGVREGAAVGKGRAYRNKLPVVFYGSSITQGACASRPGLGYVSIAARRLDLDYINLGFSGSGKAEDSMVEYLASLPMMALVCDYDHNAPDAEHLMKTHKKMYETIRAARPTLPYVILSRPDFDLDYEASIERRDVIIDTFRFAWDGGDRNVYFIDGEGIFRGPDREECTVDKTHPSDIGCMKIADSVGAVLLKVLRRLDSSLEDGKGDAK